VSHLPFWLTRCSFDRSLSEPTNRIVRKPTSHPKKKPVVVSARNDDDDDDDDEEDDDKHVR
jgi:hypothetical protein